MVPSQDPLFSPRHQNQAASTNSKPPRRNLSWLLPIGLLIGFLITAWMIFGQELLPARDLEVTTVAAIRSPAGSSPAENTNPGSDRWDAAPLFQASGWIESDPYPIRATALTNGFVDKVFALEGQAVQEGELIATLVDDDARLALAAAQARLEAAEHDLQNTRLRIEAAKKTREARQAQIEAAQARLGELRDESERLQRIGAKAVSGGEIRRAALRVNAQEAILAAREAELAEWDAQVDALRASERQGIQKVEEASVLRDERQLTLDRTRITSPTDGIIQRLLAAPGRKRIVGMDDPDSSTIAILYHPDALQARIDVPLEQAAGLHVGQPVYVRTNFLPDLRLRGEVSRIVGEADLQRNTLQAKVALLDPDPRLRPEMLCRAEFLPPANTEGQGESSDEAPRTASQLRLFVPATSILGRSAQSAGVWTVSPADQTLQRREVRLGPEEREGFVEIVEGLKPGQRVILNPPNDLAEGEPIRPIPVD